MMFFWHCVMMLKLHHSMISFWCFSMINNTRPYNKYLPRIAFSTLSVLLLMMVLPLLRNTCNGNLWKFGVTSSLLWLEADSNSLPVDYESSALTTRPHLYMYFAFSFCTVIVNATLLTLVNDAVTFLKLSVLKLSVYFNF